MTIRPAQLRLMLVTDQSVSRRPLLETIEAALAGGATAVMLREKDFSARDLYDLAAKILPLARRAGALLIVNDRIDVALAAGVDGAHLGWRSLSVKRARGILGPDRLLGFSSHSPEEAARAEADGADYVTFGPVFPTPSKTGLVEVQGIEGLRRARAAVRIPLIALGGINSSNAAQALEAGADGVAAIRALLEADDPEQAARSLRVF